jgi:hypothetical protein
MIYYFRLLKKILKKTGITVTKEIKQHFDRLSISISRHVCDHTTVERSVLFFFAPIIMIVTKLPPIILSPSTDGFIGDSDSNNIKK